MYSRDRAGYADASNKLGKMIASEKKKLNNSVSGLFFFLLIYLKQ